MDPVDFVAVVVEVGVVVDIVDILVVEVVVVVDIVDILVVEVVDNLVVDMVDIVLELDDSLVSLDRACWQR